VDAAAKEILMATVTDPVCGMQIDPSQAAGQSQYEGQTYYFCSLACKRQFDASPQQYVSKRTAQG
jgi:Cu+-exporting ATPase